MTKPMALSLMSTSQANITLPQIPSANTTFIYPVITYTKDVTIPGQMSPKRGMRYALSLSGAPGGLSKVQFGTVLADFRLYMSFDAVGRYTFAMRGSGAYSFGPSAQMFYSAGVSNCGPSIQAYVPSCSVTPRSAATLRATPRSVGS